MKLEKLVGERFKERPSDCVINSHALMIRGGYMKYVANGIFSQYTILKRICRKIEQIIREEMDAIDGQEVNFPVVMPATLWEESGRFATVGSELVRFNDRNRAPLVLGMTHEEAAVHLVKEYGKSYTKYPFMIYQIQTKFRDEARPRGGLIRVREFTMKDAYSFHTTQEDLENYYEECFKAYQRIYKRAGIPEVVAVTSDSGMMGGNVSDEFMLLTPIGEDSIVLCTECDYRANMEAAVNIVINDSNKGTQKLELIHTPDIQSIEQLGDFFKISSDEICKAVVYQTDLDNSYIICFIRGDFEINETKIKNFIGEEIHPASIDGHGELIAGFIGPKDIGGEYTLIFDSSLQGMDNLVCGANKKDFHYRGFNLERELNNVEFIDIAKVKNNSICPNCHKPSLSISRGIEVGNIFQLGTKYTKAMKMQYINQEGNLEHPIMGCYGIGIGRLAASVCEVHHDDFGPIWPISIAPFEVHLCCVRSDDKETKNYADKLYTKLQQLKVEVLYDDRQVRPGVMFSDADLLGVPVRVVISPRNMKESCCEIMTRDKKINTKVHFDNVIDSIQDMIRNLYEDIENM